MEDAYFCDNCSRQTTDPKALIITNCCKCHFCEQCVENRVNMNLLNSKQLWISNMTKITVFNLIISIIYFDNTNENLFFIKENFIKNI